MKKTNATFCRWFDVCLCNYRLQIRFIGNDRVNVDDEIVNWNAKHSFNHLLKYVMSFRRNWDTSRNYILRHKYDPIIQIDDAPTCESFDIETLLLCRYVNWIYLSNSVFAYKNFEWFSLFFFCCFAMPHTFFWNAWLILTWTHHEYSKDTTSVCLQFNSSSSQKWKRGNAFMVVVTSSSYFQI